MVTTVNSFVSTILII